VNRTGLGRNRCGDGRRRAAPLEDAPPSGLDPADAAIARADRGAWIWACAAFAAGLLLFTVRGPRTRLSDDS
jgi:hypothetical protein